MDNLVIRKATMNDIKGIQNIHRDCDDPWHDYDECKNWVGKRLERGFYIQLAVVDDKIVGHGEWIISEEPNQKMLYLGMLQVDSEYQRQGIGRAMLKDGEMYAKQQNCKLIATIPDNETGSVAFYLKYGFLPGRRIKQFNIATDCCSNVKFKKERIDHVPFSVIKYLPFIFGLAQVSSRHMWEVCNEPPKNDNRETPAILTQSGDYIQFSYYKPSDTGLVLCWSPSDRNDDLLKHILSFGHECGLKYVNFTFFEEYEDCFRKLYKEKIGEENIELYKFI